MTRSLISCIVPVFNGERYLREALESIFRQSYQPLEVIIVDDGSTDGTAMVAAAYREKVIYLRQDNAGPAAARNLGLSVARGEFVAFLDADDAWHQEKLARQMARFAARSELDLCITFVQNFWIPELQKKVAWFANPALLQPFPGYITQALLTRRALFDTVGQFDPNLHHADLKDWFLRASEQGVVLEVLPDVLVYRRLHETNMSHRKAVNDREEKLRIVKAALDRRRRLHGVAHSQDHLPSLFGPEKK
jgi:glycosyltransferase involved in cell wall biosynthesis